jgi:hypothetical protein
MYYMGMCVESDENQYVVGQLGGSGTPSLSGLACWYFIIDISSDKKIMT